MEGINEALNRDAEIAQAKADRDLVGDSGYQALKDAAGRLQDRGQNGNSTDLALATEVAGTENLEALKDDRDLLRSVGANSIHTRLEALEAISTAKVVSGAGTNDDPWVIEYTSSDGVLHDAIGPVGTNVHVGARQVADGTYTQTLYLADSFQIEFGSGGEALTISEASAPTDLQASLQALDAIESVQPVTGAGTRENPWIVEYTSAGGTLSDRIGSSETNVNVTAPMIIRTTYRQEISLDEDYSGAEFELTLGAETLTITKDNASSELQAKLQALAAIDTVAPVTGASTAGDPWVVEYTGNAGMAVEALGTTNPNVHVEEQTVAHTTYAQTLYLADFFEIESGSGGDPLAISIADAAVAGPADAVARLEANGLTADATDGEIARVLIDPAVYQLRKADRDIEPILTLAMKPVDVLVDLAGTISLVEDSTDHQYRISELASDLSLWSVDLVGTVDADLPMYFPTEDTPMGGSAADENGDGYPDHVLHMDGEFRGKNDYDFNFIAPNIDVSKLLFALLNDPKVLLAGLEGFFYTVDSIVDGIDSIELPLTGGEPFDNLADSLRGARVSVLGRKSGDDYQDGLGKWLQDKIREGDQDVFAEIIDALRSALFEGLGSLNNDLFAFLVPDYDESGALRYDKNGKIVTKLPQSADDIQLVLTPDGAVTFNLMFGGALVDGHLPIDFSAGLPGLNLNVDATIHGKIDYLMGLGLGLSGPRGVYLDTRGINDQAEEIALDVNLDLAPGSQASGTLGFLKMRFTDVSEEGGSGIRGHFGLDIADENGDGAWTLGEKLELALNASAYAQADLHAVIDTVAGACLPSVSATIHYDQQLADVTLSTGSGARFDSGSPEVVLEDVTLDVGSVFDSFLGDTFDTMYEIVRPMKPVADLLLTEIDVGIMKLKFIDIAYLRLPAKVVDTAKKVLEVIDSTIEFLEKVRSLSEFGSIKFGDFNLTEDPQAEITAQDVRGAKSAADRNSQLGPDTKKLTAGPDMKGLDKGKSSKKKSGKTASSIKRFSIPVLEDPMSLLDFILGRGEADLFWYDLPDLSLDFTYSQTFPVFTGLNAGFFGQIAAYTNFDFGFDTRGLRQWMDTGFDLAESWRIFNGFYLDDHGQENTPQDLDEITLRAGVGAIASLGVGGLVEAGVKGGIEAEIGFDLNDKETQFLDDQPVGDGKMYGSELIERISHGPHCLFDVHGDLSVFLEAFLWIGLNMGFSQITLFEIRERFVDQVIASFDWECIHEAPEDIAVLSGNTLTLRYSGSDSGGAHNYTVDVLEAGADLTLARLMETGYLDTEYYTRAEENGLREQLAAWRQDHAGEDVILVSTGLRAELFLADQVDSLVINGTPGADRYSLKRLNGRLNQVQVDAGDGDDVIQLIGDDDNSATLTSLVIQGGGGDDYIVVDSAMLGAGTYGLHGGADDDRAKLDGTNTGYSGLLLDGGSGDDVIFGGEGLDHVQGGPGFDVIATYGGNDFIEGGDEPDSDLALYTDAQGKTQVSAIYQADGTPFGRYNEHGWPLDASGQSVVLTDGNHVLRSLHGDVIDGGTGDDEVYGGHGYDHIGGGEGFNTIHGGPGDDVIDAGTGAIATATTRSIPTGTASLRATPRCAKALISTATTSPRAASISSTKTVLPACSRQRFLPKSIRRQGTTVFSAFRWPTVWIVSTCSTAMTNPYRRVAARRATVSRSPLA